MKESKRIQCTLYILFGFIKYNDVQSTAKIFIFLRAKSKCKVIPLQARFGPEGG